MQSVDKSPNYKHKLYKTLEPAPFETESSWVLARVGLVFKRTSIRIELVNVRDCEIVCWAWDNFLPPSRSLSPLANPTLSAGILGRLCNRLKPGSKRFFFFEYVSVVL